MSEEVSIKILAQTSENIQKLADLTTRIDERVKLIQMKQSDLEDRIENVIGRHTEILQKIAVLESHNNATAFSLLSKDIEETDREVYMIDKRLISVESISGSQQERWKGVTSFLVQLIWIILAAWVLMKLNLNPPPIP